MKLSDSISLLSLVIAILAFLVSTYPHITDWKRTRRKSLIYFKKLITSTNWTNEGDISTQPKSYFSLRFLEIPGRTNIYAELIVNGNESVMLRGKISPDGTMRLCLNLTVGWREIPSAEVILTYDEDEDLLTYHFKNYLGQNGLNDDLSRLDFTWELWRSTLEVESPSYLQESAPFLPPQDSNNQ